MNLLDQLLKIWPLIAVAGGAVGWGLTMAYRISQAVTRIEESLKSHAILHEHHTGNHFALDGRVRSVEVHLSRHSAQIEAIQP